MGVELNRPKSITQIIFEKYKKVVVAFILIILLFVLGEIILSNFLRVDQVLLTLKLASFTALFALCQMIVISAGVAVLICQWGTWPP